MTYLAEEGMKGKGQEFCKVNFPIKAIKIIRHMQFARQMPFLIASS